MRSQPFRMRGELALFIAMALNSLGIVLMLHSGGGITAVASFPYAISEILPALSLGIWNFIFQCVLVLSLMGLRRRIVPQYLCSFAFSFVFGRFLDFHNAWVAALPRTPGAALLCYACGYLLLAFGIALSNCSKMPILPTDLFPREAAELFRIPYQRFKIIYDVCCVTGAVVLMLIFFGNIHGIGIGTVFAALTMGILIGKIARWLQRRIWFVSIFEPKRECPHTLA